MFLQEESVVEVYLSQLGCEVVLLGLQLQVMNPLIPVTDLVE